MTKLNAIRLNMRRTGATFVAMVVVGVIAPASADAASPPQIDILSPAKVEVSADKSSDTSDVVLRNAGTHPAQVSVRVDAPKNAPSVSPSTITVASLTVKRVTLTFTPTASGATAAGALVASAEGAVPASVSFTSTTKKESPWWVYAILFGALGVSTVFILARWRTRTKGRYNLKTRLGPVDWDLSKSWASNLTIVGALLGTIISASVLPDSTSAPKGTYAGLNLFFGALIVIGPFLYTATQRAKPVHRTKTVKEPQFQGFVWSFLLATLLIMWAVLGEIATTFAVFEEIRVGHTMPIVAVWLFGGVMGVGAVLLLVMGWTRIDVILKYQSDLPKQRRRHLETHPELMSTLAATKEKANQENKDVVEPELPSWHMP